jgi:hypothetical protein
LSDPLNGLAARLQLSDEELLVAFELDALDAIAGRTEHLPAVAIIDTLSAEAEERLGGAVLARWLRAGAPGGRPLDLLLARDYGRFEDALTRRIDELD